MLHELSAPKDGETGTVCTTCPGSRHLVSFQPHTKHEAAFWQFFVLTCPVLTVTIWKTEI